VPDIIGQLRQFRLGHGLSQEQIARALGVSVVTVNRWESRRSAPSARSSRRIGELVNHGDQPSKTRPARPVLPFPADPVPFTGRSRELASLLACWPHQRLLTLTGPGGIGKSRLAAELLRRAGQAPVTAVSLDLIPDPVLVPGEISAALGRRGLARAGRERGIAAALREVEGVLFLDGCEQVADGLRGLLEALVSQAPNLRVLATSRIPLRVTDERVWPVPGLACPAPAAGRGPGRGGVPAAANDAVRFFLARVAAKPPRDAGSAAGPVSSDGAGRLCRLLEGAPLALALAAGRLDSLPVDELIIYWEDYARWLSAVGPGEARPQIVGAATEWSAALLSRDDRSLLGDLSVFAGPFGSADAEMVIPDLPAAAVRAGISRLSGLSWIAVIPGAGDQPYRLPRPLRDWARRELARSGREGFMRQRHALYIRDLCRRADAEQSVRHQGNWPERLEQAAGDIRAALQWADRADAVLAAELAASLLGWWRASGRLDEGRHWLRACREPTGRLPAWWEARASCAEALLAVNQGEYQAAERLAGSALPVLQGTGDLLWAARALIARGLAARSRGQNGAARRYLSSAVDHQAARGDLGEMALALESLGSVEAEAGHLRAAADFYQRSLTLRRELGDDQLTAGVLASLAEAATLSGNHAQARLSLEEAAMLADRAGGDHVRALVALRLGEDLLAAREFPAACTRFRAARDLAAAVGAASLHALAICGLGRALCADGQDIDGRNLLRVAEQLAMQIDDRVAIRKTREALRAVTGTEMTPRLTRRETEIMRLVDNGESDRAIADHLGIAVPTVRRHLENIFAKLNTSNRGSAAAAWRNLP
jgi:predicted ATPase/DNA-binding CsgD family transcriptional regulator